MQRRQEKESEHQNRFSLPGQGWRRVRSSITTLTGSWHALARHNYAITRMKKLADWCRYQVPLLYLQVITFWRNSYAIALRRFTHLRDNVQQKREIIKLSDYTIFFRSYKHVEAKKINGMMSRARLGGISTDNDSLLQRHRSDEILYFRYQLTIVCRWRRIVDVEKRLHVTQFERQLSGLFVEAVEWMEVC